MAYMMCISFFLNAKYRCISLSIKYVICDIHAVFGKEILIHKKNGGLKCLQLVSRKHNYCQNLKDAPYIFNLQYKIPSFTESFSKVQQVHRNLTMMKNGELSKCMYEHICQCLYQKWRNLNPLHLEFRVCQTIT